MFSARAYKRKQRLYWDELAPVYDGGLQALMLPLHVRLLDEARIKPGDRVLSVGCGTGADAFLAADLVGPSGSVVGIDIAPEMVRLAEEKARTRGDTNVTFQVMDAEDLTFPDESFDVVISQYTLMYVPDDHQALTEAHRVLKPGGRFAFGVIGRSENSPYLMVPLRIVMKHLPTVLLYQGGPSNFRFAPEGAAEATLHRAGFVEAWTGRYATMITTKDADTYWDLYLTTVASFTYRFRREPPETQEPIVREIKETVSRHATEEGIRLQVEWILAAANKPAAPGSADASPEARTLQDLVAEAREGVAAADLSGADEALGRGVLLDVRQPEEFLAGHIPGALSVPRGTVEEVAIAELADTRLPVVCYCDTGERSALAAKSLADLGFARAGWLDGGMASWTASGRSLTTGNGAGS